MSTCAQSAALSQSEFQYCVILPLQVPFACTDIFWLFLVDSILCSFLRHSKSALGVVLTLSPRGTIDATPRNTRLVKSLSDQLALVHPTSCTGRNGTFNLSTKSSSALGSTRDDLADSVGFADSCGTSCARSGFGAVPPGGFRFLDSP